MICPHGYLEPGTCPECAKLSNVQPLQLASKATFTTFELSRDQGAHAGLVATRGNEHDRALPLPALKPTRLQPDEALRISQPGNSAHLHARLAAIAPSTGTITGPSMDDVELRVKGIRQARSNPMLK